MRVLILSSSTGAGHDSCAKAIKEVFDAKSEVCDIVEVLGFISNAAANVITKSHVIMYRHFPSAFKIGYGYLERHSAFYGKGTLINKFFSLGANRLAEYIKNGGYDTVICTHPFSTVILAAALKKSELNIRTAFVATDYTCSPTVDSKSLDAYFVPDDALTDTFVTYGIDKEKIIPSGIPVRQMFYTSCDKQTAKMSAGVAPESTHLLVMCGSMGCGPIKKIVTGISDKMPEGTELTVVCGTNKRLKKGLERKHGDNSNVHIAGFVKDMSTLLDSADLYLTKPGGLSVSEARIKNLPMAFINAVAGCEEHNRKHFVDLGAAVCGDKPTELTDKCLELLKTREKIDEMAEVLSKENKTNAAEQIREYFAG